MNQSRTMSFLEAVANPLLGLGISWAVAMVVFPLYGYEMSAGKSFSINLIFFCTSFARSYVVRRWFNGLRFS